MAQQQQQRHAGGGMSRCSRNGRMGRRRRRRCRRRAVGVLASLFVALQLLLVVVESSEEVAEGDVAGAANGGKMGDDALWADAIWLQYKKQDGANLPEELSTIESGLDALPKYLNFKETGPGYWDLDVLTHLLVLCQIGETSEAEQRWMKWAASAVVPHPELPEWETFGKSLTDIAHHLTTKPEEFLTKATELYDRIGGLEGYLTLWSSFRHLDEKRQSKDFWNAFHEAVATVSTRQLERIAKWFKTMTEIHDKLQSNVGLSHLESEWFDPFVEGLQLIVSPERVIAYKDIHLRKNMTKKEKYYAANSICGIHRMIKRSGPSGALAIGKAIQREEKTRCQKFKSTTVERWRHSGRWASDLRETETDFMCRPKSGCGRAVMTKWALDCLGMPMKDLVEVGCFFQTKIAQLKRGVEVLVKQADAAVSKRSFDGLWEALKIAWRSRFPNELFPDFMRAKMEKGLLQWIRKDVNDIAVDFFLFVAYKYRNRTPKLNMQFHLVCEAFSGGEKGRRQSGRPLELQQRPSADVPKGGAQRDGPELPVVGSLKRCHSDGTSTPTKKIKWKQAMLRAFYADVDVDTDVAVQRGERQQTRRIAATCFGETQHEATWNPQAAANASSYNGSMDSGHIAGQRQQQQQQQQGQQRQRQHGQEEEGQQTTKSEMGFQNIDSFANAVQRRAQLPDQQQFSQVDFGTTSISSEAIVTTCRPTPKAMAVLIMLGLIVATFSAIRLAYLKWHRRELLRKSV